MNDRGHASSEELELLALGALGEHKASWARDHLEECAQCRGLAEEMASARQRFESRVARSVLPKLWERAQPTSFLDKWTTRWRVLVPVLAGVAAAALLVVGRPHEADLAVKGGPVVQVFGKRGETVFRVTPATRLVAGDRIRFVVEPGGSRRLLIASVDGARRVSIYFPEEGGESGKVEPGRTELSGSIELDAAEGPERLFAFFSDRPLSAERVRRRLAEGLESVEVDGVRPVTLTLEKEGRQP